MFAHELACETTFEITFNVTVTTGPGEGARLKGVPGRIDRREGAYHPRPPSRPCAQIRALRRGGMRPRDQARFLMGRRGKPESQQQRQLNSKGSEQQQRPMGDLPGRRCYLDFGQIQMPIGHCGNEPVEAEARFFEAPVGAGRKLILPCQLVYLFIACLLDVAPSCRQRNRANERDGQGSKHMRIIPAAVGALGISLVDVLGGFGTDKRHSDRRSDRGRPLVHDASTRRHRCLW